jgi:hypothetical protein
VRNVTENFTREKKSLKLRTVLSMRIVSMTMLDGHSLTRELSISQRRTCEVEPIEYEVWVEEYLTAYLEKLERKYYTGKLGHKQFLKSLEKLEQWEEQYIDLFGHLNEEEFE